MNQITDAMKVKEILVNEGILPKAGGYLYYNDKQKAFRKLKWSYVEGLRVLAESDKAESTLNKIREEIKKAGIALRSVEFNNYGGLYRHARTSLIIKLEPDY